MKDKDAPTLFRVFVLFALLIIMILCSCIAINTRIISEHTRWSQGAFIEGWDKEDAAKQRYDLIP